MEEQIDENMIELVEELSEKTTMDVVISYMKVLADNKIKNKSLEELNNRINKAIELIDLIKPDLWNISNKMTYRIIDIKNILQGSEE